MSGRFRCTSKQLTLLTFTPLADMCLVWDVLSVVERKGTLNKPSSHRVKVLMLRSCILVKRVGLFFSVL